MVSYLLLVLVVLTSPAFAFDGAWDNLRSGESADAWDSGGYERDSYGVGAHDPLAQRYLDVEPEPGHIPYNCGHIVGNPRARADCQRDWEASDPNDYLNYGR